MDNSVFFRSTALRVVFFVSFLFLTSGLFYDSALAATYSLSLATSGNVDLGVSASGSGANVATDTLNIVSTCPSGYVVSIAATSNTNADFSDTTLYKDGDSSNTDNNKKILTSTGTIDMPVSILGDNKGTWGYTTVPDATINSDYIGLTSVQTILASSLSPTTMAGSELTVYYGASIDSSKETGNYTMSDDATISYYLTTDIGCTSYQVAFNSNGGTGMMGNQYISEDIATSLDPNSFIRPAGYVFKEWNTMPDGTGVSYTDEQSVTNLAAAGNIITLYAQWEEGVYNIEYDKNASDATGAGADGYTYTYNGSFSWDSATTSAGLRAQNFKRDGYGFAGWSTDPNVASHINEANRSRIYGAGEIIYTSDDNLVAAADENNLIKLYAVWVPSTGNLQNWSGCNSLSINNVVALTDTRDNQVYAVAKLADGKCWMIENSRLHPGTANITTANTNSPTSSFISAARAIGDNVPAFCHDYTSQQCVETISFGVDSIAKLNTKSGYGDSRYGYGIYYNWYTATAGNGMMTNISAAGDLCPKGWRLPSDENGDFATLTNLIGTPEKITKFPTNFFASGGMFGDDDVIFRDQSMYLLTSSSSSTIESRNLFIWSFSSAGYNASNQSYKSRGIPFRCMSK